MQSSEFYNSPSRMILGQGPSHLLMGPGPSNIHSAVQLILADPMVSHLDPIFLQMMDEIKDMLRQVFLTSNEMTFPVSGTGSAGMELCMVNLLEPGDAVVIGVNGLFGNRMCDMAERCGATVHRVDSPWGEIVPPARIRTAVETVRPKVVAVVHAETSTGVLTPVEEISRIAHDAGALLLVDVVTSLAGCPVKVDEWRIDAAYGATQKCLSCPPGLSPVTLGPAAMEAIRGRRTRVRSWYLDVNLLSSWWGKDRVYHHTAPISMNYALHQALKLVLEEGLETRWERHRRNHERLDAGLRAMGLDLVSQPGHRLWQLNSLGVPPDVDAGAVRRELCQRHGIEIGEGLGPLRHRIWRVGLMGETSKADNVDRFLECLKQVLGK